MLHSNTNLVIGTRGSQLAINQANQVRDLIVNKTNIKVDIKIIKTKGDTDLLTPLKNINDKGFFTKEIEQQLIENKIDLAVHSMKDLPTKLPENLKIGAVIKRDSPMDVIITKNKSSFNFLESHGTIATGSLRRELQLKLLNKNLKFVDIRGNIETRIKKLMNNNWDGLIMAKAAINRLNLKINYQEFKVNEMIPAANQGVIGIEVNDERTDLDDLLKLINDKKTRTISDIESSIIDQLNGGCTTPIGCLVNLNNDEYIINIFLSNKSGTKQIVKQFKFKSKSIFDLTGEIVSELYSLGAKEIVKEYTN
tara:strand:+ start:150 stop:1076 length:927 start_codon:yes stop_codon:yes gene_type:complete